MNASLHFAMKIHNAFPSWKQPMVDHNPLLPTLVSVKEESSIINEISCNDLGNGRILLDNCSRYLEILLAATGCTNGLCHYLSFLLGNDVFWIHGNKLQQQ